MPKRIPVTIISAALLTVLISILLIALRGSELDSMFASLPKSLTAEQTAALREEYPLRSGEPAPALETIVSLADTLLYAKVLGRAAPGGLVYGEEDLHWLTDYFGYELEVVGDSAGKHKKGTVLKVSADALSEDLFPYLTEGMEIVVPIAKRQDRDDVYEFTSFGMFYVGGNGYAFSAYDMDDAVAKDGTRADLLMKELWKTRKR